MLSTPTPLNTIYNRGLVRKKRLVGGSWASHRSHQMTNIWLRFEFGSEWKRLREIREPWQINKNKYQIKVMCRLHSGFTLRVSDTCQRRAARSGSLSRSDCARGSQPSAISAFSCIKTHARRITSTKCMRGRFQTPAKSRQNAIRAGCEIWRARIPIHSLFGGVHTRASLKLTPLAGAALHNPPAHKE